MDGSVEGQCKDNNPWNKPIFDNDTYKIKNGGRVYELFIQSDIFMPEQNV